MKVLNCRNVKFKGEFVLNNITSLRKNYKFNSGVLALIEVAKRDGLKCDTCGNCDIHFKLIPESGMAMFMGKVRMTRDHDLLNSLNGSDDVDNQHLLCEDCNQLRGNRFAQYKEFKDWYESVIAEGKDPKKVVNKLNRNFSYTDYEKNGYSNKNPIQIVQKDVMPDYLKEGLTKHFLKHNAFRVTKDFYSLSTMYSYTEKAWDDFLNELMVLVVKHRTNKITPVNNNKFSVYKYKKSNKSLETFLLHLNTAFKKEYQERKKVAVDVTEQSFTVIPVQEEQSIAKVSVFSNILQRFKNMFQTFVAA
ncbi:HNH endonuclease [Cronobacter phage vB_CsaM_GAP32]|uniref:HNH domain-containing protein n=1 Tax=Cronobacter phage vB_CsaM_GAP32 TaxID=1141136 RepID=K4F9R7_9CAUD|nr:HNH endonuclease [Cronobacter phage vB_CsaM_GAP32]AFC21980.1 hypothetical protein GAP32_520 [Cronobacter phage vB_CsaM_GAP32]